MEGGRGSKGQWSSGKEFSNKKSIRQGDLLSHIIFNIVVNMLAILINRAKDKGKLKA
jgi:hypothetical protein